MSKQTYWIADPNGGAKALVEGVEERDRWTRVRGWDETAEPVSGDMVWAYNANTDGRTKLPFDTLAEDGYWRGVGFVPSAPAEPVDMTKDPALRDQPSPDAAKSANKDAPVPSAKAETVTPK